MSIERRPFSCVFWFPSTCLALKPSRKGGERKTRVNKPGKRQFPRRAARHACNPKTPPIEVAKAWLSLLFGTELIGWTDFEMSSPPARWGPQNSLSSVLETVLPETPMNTLEEEMRAQHLCPWLHHHLRRRERVSSLGTKPLSLGSLKSWVLTRFSSRLEVASFSRFQQHKKNAP